MLKSASTVFPACTTFPAPEGTSPTFATFVMAMLPPPRSSCLFGQPPIQVLGAERSGIRDQPPRGFHLVPGVPQQDSSHPAALQVVDDALTEGLLPVRDRLEPRVQVAHRFIPQLEEIGIEIRQVMVRFPLPGHGLPRRVPHGIRLVLLLP